MNELDMLVCMLWIGSCYFYLLAYPALKSIENNLQKSISGLRDDILKIKDVIIQRLQQGNLKLKERVSWLEDKLIQLEIKKILWNIMGGGTI